MRSSRLADMTEKGAPLKVMAWLGVAGIGVLGGLFLGNMVVGGTSPGSDHDASYAEYAGNPYALSVEGEQVEPCYDCAESHGSGVRARFASEGRMGDAFRELGAVALDYSEPPVDDYRYGGSFDDVEAPQKMIVMQSPVPLAPAPAAHTEASPVITSGAAQTSPEIPDAANPGSDGPE